MRRLIHFAAVIPAICGVFFLSEQAKAVPADIENIALQKDYWYSEKDIPPQCRKETMEAYPNVSYDDNLPAYQVCIEDMKSEMGLLEGNAKNGKCSTDIQYPYVSAVPAAQAINKALAKVAAEYRCYIGMSKTRLTYRITHNDNHLLSINFYGSKYNINSGGSCHGNQFTMTFNTETGQQYHLINVIPKDKLEEFKRYVIDYIATLVAVKIKGVLPLDDAKEIQIRKKTAGRAFDRQLQTYGVYLEKGTLKMDLNEYIVDCADGPSFPVPIPRKYIINNDILSLLR